jgi:hypothetical protein
LLRAIFGAGTAALDARFRAGPDGALPDNVKPSSGVSLGGELTS